MRLNTTDGKTITLNKRQAKQYRLYKEANGKVAFVKHSDGWRVYDPDKVVVVREKKECNHADAKYYNNGNIDFCMRCNKWVI